MASTERLEDEMRTSIARGGLPALVGAALVLTSSILPGVAHAVGTCGGRSVTISGTSGEDNINGTSGADVIDGLGGNDYIAGGQGADYICGSDGDDSINGNAQADRLWGGTGSDVIQGADGSDVVHAGPQGDIMNDGNGYDEMYGDADYDGGYPCRDGITNWTNDPHPNADNWYSAAASGVTQDQPCLALFNPNP
jgi:RTX calcium-binding nonapeptide repeat (4 copies)